MSARDSSAPKDVFQTPFKAVADFWRDLGEAIAELRMPLHGEVSDFTWRGATCKVQDSGSGTPTFLLVHGIGMGRGVFRSVSRCLEEHGRVIRVDLPGYGEAPNPPKTLTMERTGDVIAALIRERGYEHVILIGHSMGTQAVTETVARHPGIADGVVLVGPTVDKDARRAGRQVAGLARDLAGEHMKVLFLGTREYIRTGPRFPRRMRAMLAHTPEVVYPKVNVPALVIRGEHDVVCPRIWCQFVADTLPDGELVEIPGHGHETMIGDGGPAANTIIDWYQSRFAA